MEINGQPAIDVGGVRTMLYTITFAEFAINSHFKLFDGPPRRIYPHCSAEARSCGLFKILGMIIGHSILQVGVGFPYVSPVCYWYMVDDKIKALASLSPKDLDDNVALIVAKVSVLIEL